MRRYLRRVTVPTLNVAGWWDQEDFYGPLKIYETLEKHDTRRIATTWSSGPWNHGGWSRRRRAEARATSISAAPPARLLPREDPGAVVRVLAEGQGDARRSPKRSTFETGTNKWRATRRVAAAPERDASASSTSTRPASCRSTRPRRRAARGVRQLRLRSRAPGALPPAAHRADLSGGSGWPTWLVEDQRFVDIAPGRAELGDRAAERGRDRRRRHRRAPVRLHDGHATATGS